MKNNKIKRIGVLTSGGDAPGMNAAIRSIVRAAIYNKIEIYGIERGYQGLIEGKIFPMSGRSVSNIISRGGTILKTARCEEFMKASGRKKAFFQVRKNKLDAIIVIGGDGSYRGAIEFYRDFGVKCVGVPGTIDNDLAGTDYTIGFHTAVNTALDAIDKIRDTASSLERIFIVEVMGRTSGSIAIMAAIAGGAEEVLLPGVKNDIKNMCLQIKSAHKQGKISWIIINAEGAADTNALARQIKLCTKLDVRATVLGHIQRGGSASAFDRILATTLGVASVEVLVKGDYSKALGLVGNEVNAVDLGYAVSKKVQDFQNLYRIMKITST